MDLRETSRRLLRRPLFWALVYAGPIACGVYALGHVPVEVLPRFDLPRIGVIAHEPGATSRELETLVVRPLEGELLRLPRAQGVRSTMGHGTVDIEIRFARGTAADQDLQAVVAAIDRARGQLPATLKPHAEIMGGAVDEVADYVLRIPAPIAPATVERLVQMRVAPALRAVHGVRRVEVYGAGRLALWVQPSLGALHRYGVPITSLTDALRQQVVLRSTGYLSMGHQHVRLETRSLPTRISALSRLPVAGDTGPIALGDLARIVRAPVPTRDAALLDGRPSVALSIFKQPGASTAPVDEGVAAVLSRTAGLLPHGVQWVPTYDQGRLVHRIGADLGRNLLLGAGLAVAVLFWVLGTGRGIWVLAVSIPLSLLLAIAGIFLSGHSLDLMTLGALTVAVGLLADDAIIVLESIYHRFDQGDDSWSGIRNGLREIAVPDVIGTLTVVGVFAPFLLIHGLAALFAVPFALAMTLALLASLAVSLTVIPLGLGFLGARPRREKGAAGRAMERLRHHNERLLHRIVRHPRAGLAGCLGLVVASAVGLAIVPIHFLPLPNEGVLLESFSLPPGTSLADTRAVIGELTGRLRADPAVAHTFVRIGSPAESAYTEPAYAGEIQITLRHDVEVTSLDAIARRLLARSATPGVQLAMDTPTLERVGESLSGLPQPFVIRIFGDRIAQLRQLAGQMTERLHRVPGLSGVFDNDAYPITQLQILPRPRALAAVGLAPTGLEAQLEPLLAGAVVARVPEGGYPLDLYVRLADAPSRSLSALRQLPIRTVGWTPLGELAELKLVSTPNQIRHIDGMRSLEILATPRGTPAAAIRASRRALADLQLPSGYRVGFGGLYPELEQAAIAVGLAALASLLLMAAILALFFDGLLVPALIFLQIPLAASGGAIALVLSGVGLNATGLIGFLALIGLALNHDIVLFHRVRRNEAAGMTPPAAVEEAVRVRFRPIVLTTLTAVLGMLPTALGFGQGAAPEQGLAIVVLGGILWSAFLSINLVPALYLKRRSAASGAGGVA